MCPNSMPCRLERRVIQAAPGRAWPAADGQVRVRPMQRGRCLTLHPNWLRFLFLNLRTTTPAWETLRLQRKLARWVDPCCRGAGEASRVP
jgi:hypothetical protein